MSTGTVLPDCGCPPEYQPAEDVAEDVFAVVDANWDTEASR